MFNNLENTQLADMSDDDLSLLGLNGEAGDEETDDNQDQDQKDKKPAGKQSNQEKKTPAKQPAKSKSDVVAPTLSITDISDDDLSTAMNGQEEGDDEDEDEDDENKDNQEGTEKDNPDGEEEEQNNEEGGDDNLDVKDFIKARVDFLIQKGEWVDFQGREDVEWDEDTFADMEIKQREYAREVMREEILDSFGPYGKQIADYVSNGGNPDELIDLFKEEQRIDQLSIETEDGQKTVVYKYLTEVMGKSATSANKLIQTYIVDKELEAEAKEAKELMAKNIEKQVAQLQKSQLAENKEREDKQKAALQQFSNDVINVVNSNGDIPADEKKQIIDALTKFDKKTKNGQPVNEFYFKFAEIKKNLPDYINLVRFVMNPKKFTETLITQGNNKAADKAFKLIRTSNQNKKVKTAAPSGSGTPGATTKFRLI